MIAVAAFLCNQVCAKRVPCRLGRKLFDVKWRWRLRKCLVFKLSRLLGMRECLGFMGNMDMGLCHNDATLGAPHGAFWHGDRGPLCLGFNLGMSKRGNFTFLGRWGDVCFLWFNEGGIHCFHLTFPVGHNDLCAVINFHAG